MGMSGHGYLGYRVKSHGRHSLSDRRSGRSFVARLDMKPPKKPPTYSPEQSKVLTDRMFTLRANWLNHVETQLARQQNRKNADQPVALTNREQQIAFLIGRGFTNKGIARELVLSEGTVKIHAHNIFQKLGVKTRAELIYALARR
jgi:DNA-binding NarL/FixJ family response regulator